MNIAVFCAASNKIDSRHFDEAREIGTWMGRNGHTLVFGGSNQGLMRAIFDSVRQAGGNAIGVLPAMFEEGGRGIPGMDEIIHTADLAERKREMLDRADVALILPGGVGTLDELFTTLADLGLGYHKTLPVICNFGGYWDSLVALMKDLEQAGALHHPADQLYRVADTPAALFNLLTSLK